MMARIHKLIEILEELQNVSYEDTTAARAHNANANAAFFLIFHIGRTNAQATFTEEQKSAIASYLHSAIIPLQINIERHGFEFSRHLNAIILKKRSALQFLAESYGRYRVEGQNETLSDVFERVDLSETIGILDEIIDHHRSKRDSDNTDFKNILIGIPPTHTWWYPNTATFNGDPQEKDNVEAKVRFMHESTRATAAVSTIRVRNNISRKTAVLSVKNDPTNIIQNFKNLPETSQQQQVSDWQAFLQIFRVSSLDEIKIHGLRIFRSLTLCQKKTLKYIISALRKIGAAFLKRTVEIVMQIFNTVDLQDISFFNFVILSKFVSERMIRRNEVHRMRQDPDALDSFYQRGVHLLRMTSSWIVIGSVLCIIKRFQEIRTQIQTFSLPIKFKNRNLYSAVYYYYKRRIVGGYELSVDEYFDIVMSNLSTISTTREFAEFLANKNIGEEFRFEKYYSFYEANLLIKIKRQGEEDGGSVDLSTCCFEDDYDGNDSDMGNVPIYYINGRRIKQADDQHDDDVLLLRNK